DRSWGHAVGTDRLAAPGAVHASHHAGMAITGLDPQAGRPFAEVFGVAHAPDGTTQARKTAGERSGAGGRDPKGRSQTDALDRDPSNRGCRGRLSRPARPMAQIDRDDGPRWKLPAILRILRGEQVEGAVPLRPLVQGPGRSGRPDPPEHRPFLLVAICVELDMR